MLHDANGADAIIKGNDAPPKWCRFNAGANPPRNRMWLSCASNTAASLIATKSCDACQPSVFIPPSPMFNPKKMIAAPTNTTTAFNGFILFILQPLTF
jgi:hypothetical protein